MKKLSDFYDSNIKDKLDGMKTSFNVAIPMKVGDKFNTIDGTTTLDGTAKNIEH